MSPVIADARSHPLRTVPAILDRAAASPGAVPRPASIAAASLSAPITTGATPSPALTGHPAPAEAPISSAAAIIPASAARATRPRTTKRHTIRPRITGRLIASAADITPSAADTTLPAAVDITLPAEAITPAAITAEPAPVLRPWPAISAVSPCWARFRLESK